MSKNARSLIEEISEMTMADLLEFTMGNPEYLTDSYYRDIGNAMQKRADELLKDRQ
jgi:hypothetical protein